MLTYLALLTGHLLPPSAKVAMSYHEIQYYANVHTLDVAVDSGQHGRKEFQAGQATLATKFALGEGDVRRLWNGKATYGGITTALKELAQRSTKSDRVVVDVVGHGYRAKDGIVSLVTESCGKKLKDGDPGLLPMRTILTLFKAIPARHKWLILDACYAGSLRNELAPGRISFGQRGLLRARSLEGVAVWLGSRPGERTTFTPGGMSTLHGAIARASGRPDYYEDLEGLERDVIEQGGEFVAGACAKTHGQMLLGHGNRPVRLAAPIALPYTRFAPDSVVRAVKEMETELLRTHERSGQAQALLEIECARALRQWPVPDEFQERHRRAVFLLKDARDALEGTERRNATLELAEALAQTLQTTGDGELADAVSYYNEVLRATSRISEPYF